MHWSDLQYIKDKKNIPPKGQMLAYTRKKVIFHGYESLEDVAMELAEEDLLELHLFDSEREYRSVSTISRRFPGGVIETLADFPNPENEQDVHSDPEGGKDKRLAIDTVYSEQILLDTEQGSNSGTAECTITVLNHIQYDPKNGMASIDNYRLKM